jgi:glycosyltransferase involved in cell wall biosynthesis
MDNPRCLICFWGTGGAGVRFAHRIGLELGKSFGAENVGLSLHSDNPWVETSRNAGFDISLVHGAKGYANRIGLTLSALPRFLKLLAHVRKLRPDVLIVPMNFALAWPVAPLVARLARIPLIYVVHDAKPHPGDYAPLLQDLTQRGLIAQASALVALSSYVGENLRGSLQAKRRSMLSVIPLGKHIPRSAAAQTVPEQTPTRFLFLGRLLAYKGLDLLAEAVEGLAHRDDWRLTIAGNGRHRDLVIERFASMRQVDLGRLDWLLESEIDDLIRSNHILICPYLEASQSGVISEAAAMGMPAIVTPVGGLPEQVRYGAAGWVSPTVTAADLRQVLEHAIDHPEERVVRSGQALESASPEPGATSWASLVTRTIHGIGRL